MLRVSKMRTIWGYGFRVDSFTVYVYVHIHVHTQYIYIYMCMGGLGFGRHGVGFRVYGMVECSGVLCGPRREPLRCTLRLYNSR